MRHLLANIDKKEYVQPIALGGAHGSKYSGVAASLGACDWQWLLLLTHLIERGAPAPSGGANTHRQGTWAGDRILILRADDNADFLLAEDEQALKLLGCEKGISPYTHVREHFTDLTEELKSWSPDEPSTDESNFIFSTGCGNSDWYTAARVRRLIEHARQRSDASYRGYLEWLFLRPDLTLEGQAKVEEAMREAAVAGQPAEVVSHELPGM